MVLRSPEAPSHVRTNERLSDAAIEEFSSRYGAQTNDTFPLSVGDVHRNPSGRRHDRVQSRLANPRRFWLSDGPPAIDRVQRVMPRLDDSRASKVRSQIDLEHVRQDGEYALACNNTVIAQYFNMP